MAFVGCLFETIIFRFVHFFTTYSCITTRNIYIFVFHRTSGQPNMGFFSSYFEDNRKVSQKLCYLGFAFYF